MTDRIALPPFAARSIAAVAAVTAAVLVGRAGRYGWFGDELYFLAAGHRPAFGYVDQGPLIPLLARAADLVDPGSAVALRLPSIVATVAAILVTAALAREIGGGPRAQLAAAVSYATCPFAVTQAATLSTFALDATATAALAWLVVRWSRSGEWTPILFAAAVAAVDVQVKLLVAVPIIGLAAGLAGRRPTRTALLQLAAAGSILAVAAAPGLAWQIEHDWPQLAMGPVIRAEQLAATGGVPGLPVQWLLLAGPAGALFGVAGLWGLLRAERLRPFRFLAVTVVLQAAFVVVTGTRPYYLAGLFPVLFAAGAVRMSHTRWSRISVPAVLVCATAVALGLVTALPLPASSLHHPTRTRAELSARLRLYGTDGWDRLVDATAAAAAIHPATAVVTKTYWQAAALDQLGRHRLPPVYSPNRGFAAFGPPPDAATTVLYVGDDATEVELRTRFATVVPVGRLDDPLGFPGIDRTVTVLSCTGPVRPWSALWPQLTTNELDDGL
ncbi:ArnT family glycosyltransferase [Nocardia stercoris]|nr:glycosyltransferase family 39 protein [Nocardia stercoris]